MDRRQLIAKGVVGVGAVAAGAVLAASDAMAANAKSAKAEKKSPEQMLIETSIACIQTGELCLGHCMQELGSGNNSMAKCALKVEEMLTLCGSLVKLTSLKSAHAKKIALATADACKECRDACNEHKAHFSHGMHLTCKDCADACEACEKACRAV